MARGKRSQLQRTRIVRKEIVGKEAAGLSLQERAAQENQLHQQYIAEMINNRENTGAKLLASTKMLLTILPPGKYQFQKELPFSGAHGLKDVKLDITVSENPKKLYRAAQKEMRLEISFAERVEPVLTPGGHPNFEFVIRKETLVIKRPNTAKAEMQYARNDAMMLTTTIKQTALTDLVDLLGSKEILTTAIPAIYEKNAIPKLAWERVKTNKQVVGTGNSRTVNPLLRK
jgi:hypothetical protein